PGSGDDGDGRRFRVTGSASHRAVETAATTTRSPPSRTTACRAAAASGRAMVYGASDILRRRDKADLAPNLPRAKRAPVALLQFGRGTAAQRQGEGPFTPPAASPGADS